MRRIAIGMVRLYQWVFSPFVGMHCRFDPSCSNYAVEAFRKHGTIKGLFYTVRRIARCHPWQAGGYDPVP